MTPIEKAKWLAEFYNAVAEGKTVQVNGVNGWIDVPLDYPDMPAMFHTLSRWRIKPEPRRMWTDCGGCTYNEKEAAEWKAKGLTVTEWVEVI